jgi:AbrB family transcriptional regulator, transcriptional pleiotropic regulator of transition state genes
MVRKIDRLGRIGVPVNLRRDMDIEISDDIEIFLEHESIVLKKVQDYQPCMVKG